MRVRVTPAVSTEERRPPEPLPFIRVWSCSCWFCDPTRHAEPPAHVARAVLVTTHDADGQPRRVARVRARVQLETHTITQGDLTMTITVIPGKSSFDWTIVNGATTKGQAYMRPKFGGKRGDLVAAFIGALKKLGATIAEPEKTEPKAAAKKAAKKAAPAKKAAKQAAPAKKAAHPGPRPAPKPSTKKTAPKKTTTPTPETGAAAAA
jgi:hypothetical protein